MLSFKELFASRIFLLPAELNMLSFDDRISVALFAHLESLYNIPGGLVAQDIKCLVEDSRAVVHLIPVAWIVAGHMVYGLPVFGWVSHVSEKADVTAFIQLVSL